MTRRATTSGAGNGARGPEEIQREIEDTRQRLADTVGAVAEKADVKRQAKRKAEAAREQLGPILITSGIVATGALGFWALRRRRRKTRWERAKDRAGNLSVKAKAWGEKVGHQVGEAGRRAGDEVSERAGEAGERAGELSERLGDRAGKAGERVGERIDSVR